MPKVSQAHAAARRRQILEAAWSCFARAGFHGTTVPDICRAAGLSTGAVYSYFGSKEEIIEEGARQALASTLAEMRVAGGEREGALGELLRRFVLRLGLPALVDAIRADVALWGEAATNPRIADVMERNVRALREHLASLVKRAQRRGEIPEWLEAGAVARLHLALYLGAALQRLVDPQLDPERYAQAVEALRFTGQAARPRGKRIDRR